MRFAIALPTHADSWRVVRRAEQLGFHRAWFYDTQMLSADPFVAMAAAALKNKNPAGDGIDPIDLIAAVAANAFASPNKLAPGRIDFGVGTGFTGQPGDGTVQHRGRRARHEHGEGGEQGVGVDAGRQAAAGECAPRTEDAEHQPRAHPDPPRAQMESHAHNRGDADDDQGRGRHAVALEARQLDELHVPPTVRDSVLERAARLGQDARAVLQAAAVLTDPAGEPTLTAVAGFSSGRARAGLAEVLACGLLAEDKRYLVSFRHLLAARAIYDEIPSPRRRDIHLRAAQALEKQTPLPLAQLARHFREAGDTAKWAQYAEQAADLALTSGDQATAAALLHDLLTNVASPACSVLRLTRKTPLWAFTGYIPLNDLARKLRAVLGGASLTSSERAEICFQLGRILLQAGEYDAGAAELERAIPGLAHRPVDAAHAMIKLGWPSRTRSTAQVHRRWLDRALAAAASTSIPDMDRLALLVDHATGLLDLGEEQDGRRPPRSQKVLPLLRKCRR